MPDILRSWKTTLAGVAILALVAAFLMGRITLNEFLGGFAVLTAGGLALSKDNDVSHY